MISSHPLVGAEIERGVARLMKRGVAGLKSRGVSQGDQEGGERWLCQDKYIK